MLTKKCTWKNDNARALFLNHKFQAKDYRRLQAIDYWMKHQDLRYCFHFHLFGFLQPIHFHPLMNFLFLYIEHHTVHIFVREYIALGKIIGYRYFCKRLCFFSEWAVKKKHWRPRKRGVSDNAYLFRKLLRYKTYICRIFNIKVTAKAPCNVERRNAWVIYLFAFDKSDYACTDSAFCKPQAKKISIF